MAPPTVSLPVSALFDAVASSANDAIIWHDTDGRVAGCNRATKRLTGYPGTDLIGQMLEVLFVDPSDVADLLAHVRAGLAVEQQEVELRRRDGMRVPAAVTLAPVMAEGEVAGAVTIARDLTEQRAAMITLAESEARLAEGEALAHVGGWVWDATADAVQWSAELHRIHGIEPAAFEGTLEGHLALVHPDDRATLESAVRAAPAAGEGFQLVYRIIRPDGDMRWVMTRGRWVDGGVSGIVQDITERRQAEADRHALEELERRHEQGRDIHDSVVQGLVTAQFALDLGNTEMARNATHETLNVARQIVADLLGPGPAAPGSLRRRNGHHSGQ